ncbi:hypothetical protein KCP76_26060 (plasmid) [Salmonella enterica subsp. enterica serovar Weltevreden]|nr:hypothetical protein KCP76_26060 [Salmonella enterica subsp. enterica serovar Weltevreden]
MQLSVGTVTLRPEMARREHFYHSGSRMRDILAVKNERSAQKNRRRPATDAAKPPRRRFSDFQSGGLYGDGGHGQSRSFAPRHHHALFHAPPQLPLMHVSPVKRVRWRIPASALLSPVFRCPYVFLSASRRARVSSNRFYVQTGSREPFAHKSP